MPSPTRCPACTFEGIRFSGLGTQRLEAEVQARFPHHRCLRMDADTMRRPGSHEAALAEGTVGGQQSAAGSEPRTSDIDHPPSNVEPSIASVVPTRVLGPAPCPLPKLRGEFRYQLHVQGPDGDRLRAAVRQVTAKLQSTDDLRWTVDVDPIDMM